MGAGRSSPDIDSRAVAAWGEAMGRYVQGGQAASTYSSVRYVQSGPAEGSYKAVKC